MFIQQSSPLNIAFDAKRVYQNATGLGHYSRTLVSSLAIDYPQHQYYLCAPKITPRFNSSAYSNVHNIVPSSFIGKKFKGLWRSKWVVDDLKSNNIQLYHGLSHEIPTGIQKTNIKTVVTMHDLIFERYPKQYNWLDVQIYRRKFKYACTHADHIIAISQQTKADLVNCYNTPEDKISVCYQSCNAAFAQPVPAEVLQSIRRQFNLPGEFFLYVGSIIERKNLLNICKAYALLKGKMNIPLVVIGDGGSYKKQVKQFVDKSGLEKTVIFLSETEAARSSFEFQTAKIFPAIYQLATAMLYPSVFEGFGIPVLEALWSGIPVLTSNVSCLPETGGDAAYYVDPYSPEQIAEGLLQLSTNHTLVKEMVDKGFAHARNFTPEKCATAVMQVYLRLA